MKTMHKNIYLSLGSNVGSRKTNLLKTLSLISGASEVLKVSPIYQTDPIGFEKQAKFLNMTCLVFTSYEPHDFLKKLKDIEKSIGRQKSFRNGPRLIDIDIIFWDNDVINTKALTVPHPKAAQREFVLRPLARIAPSFVHPILNKTVASLLKSLEPQGVRYFTKAPPIKDIIGIKQKRMEKAP